MASSGKTNMRAVLLAAGQGKRMKSARPKVLHEVLGKSILSRVLNAVDGLSPEHIHIIIGHGADMVREFLSANPPSSPYSLHLQEPQLGTADALKKAVPDLKNFRGTLLVSVADTPLLTSTTLKALVDEHVRAYATVSLLTTKVDDPKNYGRILRNAAGEVLGIIEDKDATAEEKKIKEINPAIYCFAWPDIEPGLNSIKNTNKQKEYYLTDLIGWAAQNGKTLSSVLAPDWREVAGINSRLELAEANRLLRDISVIKLSLESGVTVMEPESTWISPEVKIGQDSTVYPGCHLVGDIEIGENSNIGPHAIMQGRVRMGKACSVINSLVANSEVGDNVRIGPFAHLRDGNILSDGVRVGNFVELKKSVIGQKTNVSHLSYVGDATIGRDANVGAGTITANYDHITKKKERTVIGDGASTGSNSVLVAPVTLGDNAVVAGGTVVTRDVPSGALAVGRARQENKEGWADRKKKGHEATTRKK